MKFLKINIFLLMLSSALYLLYPEGKFIIALFSFGIISCTIMYSCYKVKVNKFVISIFYLFIVASSISAFVNEDVDLLSGAILLSLLFVALVITVPSLLGTKSNEYIYKAILYVHIPIIYIPLVKGMGEDLYYKGIFGNSNSLGITCVCLLSSILSYFFSVIYDYIEDGAKVERKQILFFIIMIPSLILLIIASGSRTSFISAIVLIILSIVILMKQLSRISHAKKTIMRVLKISFFFTCISLVLLKVFPIAEKLKLIILYKFKLNNQGNDLLSGRGEIWSDSFHDARLFGNGRDYFFDMGIGAHNTFISLMGQYGWLPAIIFIFFILMCFIHSLKYSIYAVGDKYRLLPLLTLTSFVFLSMGEGMLFTGQMVSAFACVGITTVFKRKRTERITLGTHLKPTNSSHIIKRTISN